MSLGEGLGVGWGVGDRVLEILAWGLSGEVRDTDEGRVVRVDVDGKDGKGGKGGPATLANVRLATGVVRFSSSSASITVAGMPEETDTERDLCVRDTGGGTVWPEGNFLVSRQFIESEVTNSTWQQRGNWHRHGLAGTGRRAGNWQRTMVDTSTYVPKVIRRELRHEVWS